MLPAIILSGMIFPIENMPLPLQAISRLIPSRYLVHGLRGILLKGNGLSVLVSSRVNVDVASPARRVPTRQTTQAPAFGSSPITSSFP